MKYCLLFLVFFCSIGLSLANDTSMELNNDPYETVLDGIHFNIKPTLASDDITISFDEIQETVKVEILDLTGRSVFKGAYNDRTRIEINVADYKRSPYFVRVTIGNKVKTKRFVKR